MGAGKGGGWICSGARRQGKRIAVFTAVLQTLFRRALAKGGGVLGRGGGGGGKNLQSFAHGRGQRGCFLQAAGRGTACITERKTRE